MAGVSPAAELGKEVLWESRSLGSRVARGPFSTWWPPTRPILCKRVKVTTYYGLDCVLPNSRVDVLPSSASGWDCVWRRGVP